jgi:hypothetical protein
MRQKKSATWVDVKARLSRLDRTGLLGVVRDLYDASDLTRRFLHARFAPTAAGLEQYRRKVRDAVFPDPFSQRPIRLRDGAHTIREYRRATGDLVGTVDLLLEFVEAGTEQAADLGYGDDSYFNTLERKVNELVRMLDTLADSERRAATARLVKLGKYQEVIGWGYGDFLGHVATKLQPRRHRVVQKRTHGDC